LDGVLKTDGNISAYGGMQETPLIVVKQTCSEVTWELLKYGKDALVERLLASFLVSALSPL